MKKNLLKNREIRDLCLGMSFLYHAGVSVGDGLILLAEDEKNLELRSLLKAMALQVDEGEPLVSAFRESGRFPDYVCNLLEVGERTGKMEESLTALAKYYEDRARLEQRLRSALLYPSVLLLIMLAVIVILLVKVLPVFDSVYAGLGGQLTGIAAGLLKFGEVLGRGMPILLALLTVVVIFLGAFGLSDSFRERILGLWRKFFGDKGISKKINTARFAQSLSMGISSGLPLEEALVLSGELWGNVPGAKRSLEKCIERLQDGSSLAKAMGDSGILPRSECALLELGFRSGNGDEVLEKIAGRLSEESETALEEKVAQVEPALVLICSVLVGLILLSVMLPLMDIMAAIG